eukprot:TRINITY_DN3578_c0_g1_i1.p5 TRINITY_DN3578_c0_g1~~TRINITY_DN3578_c0_g1_i1.p5  ORF type:complete len:121 (-),score=42.93 TRINITY_DN3578_c0_g1_i1:359-721(-)
MAAFGSQVTGMEVGGAGFIVGGLYLCVTSDTKVEEVQEEVGVIQGMWQQIVGVMASEEGVNWKDRLRDIWDDGLVRLGLKQKELSWVEEKLVKMGWLEEQQQQEDLGLANLLPALENDAE